MKIVIMVPRITLIKQMIDELIEFGISEDRISKIHLDHKTDYSKNIIVASTASFIRKEHHDFDLVVSDEGHMLNKQILKRMEDYPLERHLALTATPFTKSLGKYYSILVKGVGMRALIDMEGMGLCDYDIYAPSIPSLKDVSVRCGDFVERELERVMCGAKICGDIVSNWCEHASDRPTMIIPATVAHGNKLQAEFADVGVASEVISAKTPLDDREAIFDRIRNGTLKIVISVGCLLMGFSIKIISCLILAKPTKSKSDYIQACGRVLRFIEGKRAVIFDHSGSSLLLGLPDEIEIEELDMGDKAENSAAKEKKKKEIESLPKPCGRCGALRPAGVPQCPKCGHITKHLEDVETNRQLGLKMIKGEKKKEPTKQDKQQFYSELLGYQLANKMNGKTISDGRIAHIYKEKFKCWPRGMSDKISSPSNGLTSFIRARNIAYSKAMKAKEGL
jgi:DNA repair protein RadD